MISAINTASIRKNIPSFLTVPLGRIIRLVICDILSILSNNAYMGYFSVAEARQVLFYTYTSIKFQGGTPYLNLTGKVGKGFEPL